MEEGEKVTKVCPKCGVEKELTGENWYRHDRGGRFDSVCKECAKLRRCEWYWKEHKRNLQKVRDNYEKHREARRQHNNEYAKTQKGKANIARYTQKKIIELKDNYVKNVLHRRTGLSFSEMSEELVALKREQLLLKRRERALREKERRLMNG